MAVVDTVVMSVRKLKLAILPVSAVKYCRQSGGPGVMEQNERKIGFFQFSMQRFSSLPPFSLPHSYCVILISHILAVDVSPAPRLKLSSLQASAASRNTKDVV